MGIKGGSGRARKRSGGTHKRGADGAAASAVSPQAPPGAGPAAAEQSGAGTGTGAGASAAVAAAGAGAGVGVGAGSPGSGESKQDPSSEGHVEALVSVSTMPMEMRAVAKMLPLRRREPMEDGEFFSRVMFVITTVLLSASLDPSFAFAGCMYLYYVEDDFLARVRAAVAASTVLQPASNPCAPASWCLPQGVRTPTAFAPTAGRRTSKKRLCWWRCCTLLFWLLRTSYPSKTPDVGLCVPSRHPLCAALARVVACHTTVLPSDRRLLLVCAGGRHGHQFHHPGGLAFQAWHVFVWVYLPHTPQGARRDPLPAAAGRQRRRCGQGARV